MLRAAGAKEVHLRISSPQISWPCYYGIDTPTRSELIATSHTPDEINQYLTSDTLAYLPLEETQQAVLQAIVERAEAGGNGQAIEPLFASTAANGKRSLPLAVLQRDGKSQDRFCHACFSGDYPVPFQDSPKPRQMRLLDF
jgi:amidophosphoribosyltransferase